MQLRYWIGLVAALVVGVGAVVGSIVFYQHSEDEFHTHQKEEAVRAARQAQSVGALSVGQLATAAAFIKADENFSKHEFAVVGRSLIQEDALQAAAFIDVVHWPERASYEREQGFPIVERGPDGRLVKAKRRAVYYPVTYAAAHDNLPADKALGFDLGSDSGRLAYLRRAADNGRTTATGVIPLLSGGIGINVFRAVYRDGAPTATVEERRHALLGFAGGSFLLKDLAAAATTSLPDNVTTQLDVAHQTVVGPPGALEDPARAQIQIADRTWLLVIHDPNRPDVSVPTAFGAAGIAVAAVLASLIWAWSREERMRKLQREADEDSLSGLRTRRRFEEELRAAMARSRRDGTTGALLMIDLDNFKAVNDTFGHPAGDRLIKEVGRVLRERTREGDLLGRLGGDEFAVGLPGARPAEGEVVAEAIVRAIHGHPPDDPEVGTVTASIGVAFFGKDPMLSYTTLLSKADSAMYAAKEAGGDGFRVFHPDEIGIRSGERLS
ncbi:MAG TPA: diguanylate cyclase [Solirubrobacterales bacterium]|jgi:diguanylate cyclase (GGDEF)-like protein|nr:diguanylate cyclase [Solirubrobacterales bacterium]